MWALCTCALRILYHFADGGWSSSTIPLPTDFFDVKRRVGISIAPIGDRLQLTNEYIIRTLYALLRNMAEGTPGFFAIKVLIIRSHREVGSLMILTGPDTPRSSVERMNGTISQLESPQRNSSIILKRGLTSDTGEIIDPDSGFRISYRYDGKRVPIQDLCFAFFDALADTSQLAENEPMSHVDGISASGDVAIHIGGGGDPGTVLLAGHLQHALYGLFAYGYEKEKRFEGVDFSIFKDNVKLAEGWTLRMPGVKGVKGNTTVVATQ